MCQQLALPLVSVSLVPLLSGWVSSQNVNSQNVNSHNVNSHKVNFPKCQLLYNKVLIVQVIKNIS